MRNRRGRYPSEFRAEAVKLFRSVEGEKWMRTIATELAEPIRLHLDGDPLLFISEVEAADQAVGVAH